MRSDHSDTFIKSPTSDPPPPNPTSKGPGWIQARGGEVLTPSLGTHCEPDPKSGGSESRDRGVVTAPYPSILERWDISKGACFNILWPLKQDIKSLLQAKYRQTLIIKYQKRSKSQNCGAANPTVGTQTQSVSTPPPLPWGDPGPTGGRWDTGESTLGQARVSQGSDN